MRKNSHIPRADAMVTVGTAPDTSSPVARPKPTSAPNRFRKGFSLKQMPLRTQLSITMDVSKKAFVDLIKNAAIKSNIHPKEWTYKNIEYMREQLRSMGAMWDWRR